MQLHRKKRKKTKMDKLQKLVTPKVKQKLREAEMQNELCKITQIILHSYCGKLRKMFPADASLSECVKIYVKYMEQQLMTTAPLPDTPPTAPPVPDATVSATFRPLPLVTLSDTSAATNLLVELP